MDYIENQLWKTRQKNQTIFKKMINEKNSAMTATGHDSALEYQEQT